jgi:hypothetical protein
MIRCGGEGGVTVLRMETSGMERGRRLRGVMVATEALAVLHDIWHDWDHNLAKQREAAALHGLLATLNNALKILSDPQEDRWVAAGLLREIKKRLQEIGRDELAEEPGYVEGAYREVMGEGAASNTSV